MASRSGTVVCATILVPLPPLRENRRGAGLRPLQRERHVSPRRRVATVAKALRESRWETLHARPIVRRQPAPCLPEFGNVDLLEGAGREGVSLGERGTAAHPSVFPLVRLAPRDLRSLGPARKRNARSYANAVGPAATGETAAKTTMIDNAASQSAVAEADARR
jgi:hypothetical protein